MAPRNYSISAGAAARFASLVQKAKEEGAKGGIPFLNARLLPQPVGVSHLYDAYLAAIMMSLIAKRVNRDIFEPSTTCLVECQWRYSLPLVAYAGF